MRRFYVLAALLPILAVSALADVVRFHDSWGESGFNVIAETPEGMEIVYSIETLGVEELEIEGETTHQLALPGVILPNDAGAPNLPGEGRFIAIPQEGSARVRILASRTEVFHDVNLAPAAPIPLDTDDSPPVYERDPAIYEMNAYYPAEPVKLSEPMQMRGVDCVILGITPFQYNPVTRELVVYRDLRVSVEFVGGNGHFGEDRLRSRFWEPILQGHLANYSSLPKVDLYSPSRLTDGGYEYIIIVPDDPAFIAWGDTIKAWRKLQGITSEVFTTTQLGGNTVQAIETFIDTAYANWDPAPVAFLLLSDFENSGDSYGITSPMWNSYCRSDNMYADVNNDNLPDLCHARICAQNEAHLSTMINKFLSYEREPYTDPGFYDHPLIACGWQTDRWFQFCTEVMFGYFDIVQGKEPVHQYNVGSGNPSPGCAWSTNPNTYMVVAYFGESGLGYVPDTNPHTYAYWDNGSAAGINAAIEAGAFILQHRDHGSETGWGEPDYDIYDVQQLTNDMYPFVFTINCLTGMYDWYNECFTEAFHRSEHGALGLIAASDVSYSFVNDTYVWGYYDLMWPDFMPDYPVYPSPPLWPYTNLMPGFGNVSGKYFLQQSSWPYNPSNKNHTYHLFHMHGDAFTTLYSEVPQPLTVLHEPTLIAGQDYFVVTADEGSYIALTVDGEIIGVGEGTGAPVTITIPPQVPPAVVHVTVTKANYFRYESDVLVIAPEGPYVILHGYLIDDSVGGNNDGKVDIGETIQLPAALKNVGIEVAFDVDAVLATEDPYVTISDNYEYFGDISPDQIVWSPDDYDFQARAVCPDGHGVAFSITAEDVNDSTWTGLFNVPVHAPVLSFYSYELDDTGGGNGNGRLEPGETAELTVTLANDGSGYGAFVEATLSTIDPYVTVVSGSASYGNIAAGGTGVGSPAYVVEAAASVPEGRQAQFDLTVEAQADYLRYDALWVTVGGIFDDMEQGPAGWTHEIVTPGFVDQWHQSTRTRGLREPARCRSHDP